MTTRKQNLIVFFVFNAALFFFQLLTKKIYAPLVPHFQTSLDISSAQAGFLVTAATLGYGLARFPSGILTDIIGCKKTIISSGFFMGLTVIMVGLAPNYLSLAILTFIMGISTGLYITAGYTFTILVSKDNQEATFTAILENFGGLAATVAPLTVVLFLDTLQLGWRGLFFSIGTIILVVNGLFIYMSYNNKIEDKDDLSFNWQLFKDESKEILQVFQNNKLVRFIMWATIVGGFGFFSILAFQSFIPSLLVEKGYSFSRANQLFTLVFVIGLFAKPAIGWLADKVGTKRILFSILVLNFIFYFIFTAEVGQIGIFSSLIIFGITFAGHNTLINSYVLRLFPDEYQGTGFGLFSTLYTAIYSLGPVVIGYFVDQFNLVIGMRVSVVAIIIAVPLLVSFNYFFPEFAK